MQNGQSRILLLNFTKKDAEKLSNLSLTIERGYLSDTKESSKLSKILSSFPDGYGDKDDPEQEVDDINFYFPHPVYEYKAVFINLANNSEVKKEFDDKSQAFSNEERKEFAEYWLFSHRPIIIFLGDYNYADLNSIGIPFLTLKKVTKEDVSINSHQRSNNSSITELFNEVKPEVVMPTEYYIQGANSVFRESTSDFKAKTLYWNNKVEDLALFIDSNEGYSPVDRPVLVILPQFRNNTIVVEKFLRELAKMHPKYLPELPSLDWIESDTYYPSDVSEYDTQIELAISEASKKIEELQSQKEETKNKYKPLRGILYQSGDELKESIIYVFSNIFKLNIVDSDKENESSQNNEDILIDFSGKKFLAEIKGVKAKSPSPTFIGQVWKEISQCKKDNIDKGILILNYDIENRPDDRSLAYKGEYEDSLNDIIFIDTRVIFNLAIAIIDYGMSIEDAVLILFQDGRVAFDLKKYISLKEQS